MTLSHRLFDSLIVPFCTYTRRVRRPRRAAAKAASVRLIETRTAVGGGKGYVTMVGEVGAVRSAVAAGIGAVPEEAVVSYVVIPQAEKQLLETVGK